MTQGSLDLPFVAKEIRFWAKGESAVLISCTGASLSSVYVACECHSCRRRPLRSFASGGRILTLPSFGVHVALRALDASEIMVQSDSEGGETRAVDEWLLSASSVLGGDALLRRQLNVFSWNGRTNDTPKSDDAGPCAKHLLKGFQPPPETAFHEYGTWRAATVRSFNAETAAFEVKFHDEPKRSAAYVWLPLATLHFARIPPATPAAVRSASPYAASTGLISTIKTKTETEAEVSLPPPLPRLALAGAEHLPSSPLREAARFTPLAPSAPASPQPSSPPRSASSTPKAANSARSSPFAPSAPGWAQGLEARAAGHLPRMPSLLGKRSAAAVAPEADGGVVVTAAWLAAAPAAPAPAPKLARLGSWPDSSAAGSVAAASAAATAGWAAAAADGGDYALMPPTMDAVVFNETLRFGAGGGAASAASSGGSGAVSGGSGMTHSPSVSHLASCLPAAPAMPGPGASSHGAGAAPAHDESLEDLYEALLDGPWNSQSEPAAVVPTPACFLQPEPAPSNPLLYTPSAPPSRAACGRGPLHPLLVAEALQAQAAAAQAAAHAAAQAAAQAQAAAAQAQAQVAAQVQAQVPAPPQRAVTDYAAENSALVALLNGWGSEGRGASLTGLAGYAAGVW